MRSYSERSAESGGEDTGSLDRTHELTWALLDERITDAEMSELVALLRSDKAARESYIRCIQLHSDLAFHFAPPQDAKPAKQSTRVLGFLGSNPLIGLDSPQTDSAT
jgi:hypothetical protein